MMLIITVFSSIWGLAIGAQFVKQHNDNNNPTKLKIIYIILAIMYFVCAAFEIFGFVAVYLQRLRLVMLYFLLSVGAAIIVTASEILRLVVHFADKSEIIAACTQDQLDQNTVGDTIDSVQANSICSSSWSRSTLWDIVFLIASACLAFLFASIAASFVHQLKNPATMRTQTAHLAPSAQYAYPLAPYPGGLGAQPYPGGSQPYPAPAYAPPPGPPPPPTYDNFGDDGYTPYGGDKKEREEEGPFADPWTPAERREGEESTETVTLEPRRENEGRV